MKLETVYWLGDKDDQDSDMIISVQGDWIWK